MVYVSANTLPQSAQREFLAQEIQYLVERLNHYFCELLQVQGRLPSIKSNGDQGILIETERCDPLDFECIQRAAKLTSILCEVDVTVLHLDTETNSHHTDRYSKSGIKVRLPICFLEKIGAEDPRELLRCINSFLYEGNHERVVAFGHPVESCIEPKFEKFISDLIASTSSDETIVLDISKSTRATLVHSINPGLSNCRNDDLGDVIRCSVRSHVANRFPKALTFTHNSNISVILPNTEDVDLNTLIKELERYPICIEILKDTGNGTNSSVSRIVQVGQSQQMNDYSALRDLSNWQLDILRPMIGPDGIIRTSPEEVAERLHEVLDYRVPNGTYFTRNLPPLDPNHRQRVLPHLIGIGSEGSFQEEVVGCEVLPGGKGWIAQMGFASSAAYMPYESWPGFLFPDRFESMYLPHSIPTLPLHILTKRVHDDIGVFTIGGKPTRSLVVTVEVTRDGLWSEPKITFEDITMAQALPHYQMSTMRRGPSNLRALHSLLSTCRESYDRAFPNFDSAMQLEIDNKPLNWMMHRAVDVYCAQNRIRQYKVWHEKRYDPERPNQYSMPRLERTYKETTLIDPRYFSFLGGSFRKAMSWANHLLWLNHFGYIENIPKSYQVDLSTQMNGNFVSHTLFTSLVERIATINARKVGRVCQEKIDQCHMIVFDDGREALLEDRTSLEVGKKVIVTISGVDLKRNRLLLCKMQ